jgi:hypothetical protein
MEPGMKRKARIFFFVLVFSGIFLPELIFDLAGQERRDLLLSPDVKLIGYSPPREFRAGRCYFFIQNIGNRTIKAIEWEYPFYYRPPGSGIIPDPENDRFQWQKQRKRVKVAPQQIVRIPYSEPVPRLQIYNHGSIPQMGYRPEVIFCYLKNMRATRVVYAEGPDWTIK